MSKIIGAFEGIEGAHSGLVLDSYLKGSLTDGYTPLGLPTFRKVASAVISGQADVGVLPIDNAIAGTIRDGYDLIAEYDLEPFAEVVWRMDHRLLGKKGAALSDIREIYAHPLVLEECGRFLGTLAAAKLIPSEDTGVAAKEVASSNDSHKAAIAPPEAAKIYGLNELAQNIADHPENFTRFLLFRSRSPKKEVAALAAGVPADKRKTSLLVSMSHEKGQLAECLAVFSRAGINLTKLESRPKLGKAWEYLFYVDIEGDLRETRVRNAINELEEKAADVQIIGSYATHATANTKTDHVFELEITSAKQQAEKEGVKPHEGAKGYPLVARAAKPQGSRVKVGPITIGGDEFIVIAGPCSVESRDQVMATAQKVRENGACMLRGGAFKPRTNPYAFQGLGWEGVQLLSEAGRATGMPIVSEVMSVDQVDRMAREVDVMQIGARNMQNFDLLKAVGQTETAVMLKRGMSASLDELAAAAEYILASGNHRVMLCERGIRTFETATRFTLDLAAVPVLRERTHLPIIIDPSHGVGVRRWIRPLCRAAKAVGAHGIIVEVHPNPEQAKSDKDQALTFDDFKEIMEELNQIPNPSEFRD